MSVLTHVVLKSSLPSEPVATQSLAYILNAEPDIARAFIGIFHEAGIRFEPGNIQEGIEHNDSRPDLTIFDNYGNVRAFVENKFWAGLTEAQPVSYLGDLPENFQPALLFIVPKLRVSTVWNALKLRCCSAELEWENGLGTPNVTWSRVGRKTMLITSWSHVLETLRNTAQLGGHESIYHDILQLRNLTRLMDLEEAFLPIRADELTDQETAHRLINYCDLIKEITQKLKDKKLADTEGLQVSHGWSCLGQNLRVHKRFRLWLGIDFYVWRDAGVTPLWWRFDYDEGSGVAGRIQRVENLFKDVKRYEKTNPYFPIRLKTGLEWDTVVEDAVKQMTQIANTLLEEFPENR